VAFGTFVRECLACHSSKVGKAPYVVFGEISTLSKSPVHGGLRRQFDVSSQGDQMHKLQYIFLHLDIQDVAFACNGSCYISKFTLPCVFLLE